MRQEDMAVLDSALAGDGLEDQGTNPEMIPDSGNPTGPGPLDPLEKEDVPAPLTSGNGPIWRGAQLHLENLPMPGGLTFPIVMLLVFFFLLIPVNGHTRAVWLWLTITGNASISAGGGGSASPVEQNTQLALPMPASYRPTTIGSYVQESY